MTESKETFYGLKITGEKITTPRGTHRILEGGLDAARAAGLGLWYSHNEYSIVARDNRAFAILTLTEQEGSAAQEEPVPTKAPTQPTTGRCNVWNDHFKYCKTKQVVSISPSVYAYVASDSSMWKRAERITTSRAKLACIWSSQRRHKKPVVKWGRHQQWIR